MLSCLNTDKGEQRSLVTAKEKFQGTLPVMTRQCQAARTVHMPEVIQALLRTHVLWLMTVADQLTRLWF